MFNRNLLIMIYTDYRINPKHQYYILIYYVVFMNGPRYNSTTFNSSSIKSPIKSEIGNSEKIEGTVIIICNVLLITIAVRWSVPRSALACPSLPQPTPASTGQPCALLLDIQNWSLNKFCLLLSDPLLCCAKRARTQWG